MIDYTIEDRPRFPRDSAAAALHAPGHAEWLIDQSLAETFPASDAPLPVRPGSTAASHYSRYGRLGAARDLSTVLRAPGLPFACAAIGLTLLCAFVLLTRRGG